MHVSVTVDPCTETLKGFSTFNQSQSSDNPRTHLELDLVNSIEWHSAGLSTRLAEGFVPHESTPVFGNKPYNAASGFLRAAAVVLQNLQAVCKHHL